MMKLVKYELANEGTAGQEADLNMYHNHILEDTLVSDEENSGGEGTDENGTETPAS
jgi:hypothetical protein